MAENKKSVNLLPEFLRTDKNSKFLASTIDQLIQKPQVERIEGFVGSKLTPTYSPLDSYLNNTSSLRNTYSLQPALILKDSVNNVTDAIAYDDLINELRNHGGNTDRLDDLFRAKTHAYDPPIDWDKLVNFTDYCWLPTGPDPITLPLINPQTNTLQDPNSYIVGQRTWTMPNGYKLRNGMKIQFGDDTLDPEYEDKQYYVEGVGKSIRLIPVDSLTSFGKTTAIFNESYDTTRFDDYGFDGDRVVPEVPEYITINRASIDKNPWSQYNRWFHKDVISITNTINNVPTVIPTTSRAQRPIVEFRAHLNLYNFGTLGIPNVDLIDTTTLDALSEVHNSFGYHVDGVELQEGNRVIFNADTNFKVRSRVYRVTFDYTGPSPILKLINDSYAITANQAVVPGFNSDQVNPTEFNFIEDDPISTRSGEPINYATTNHTGDVWPFTNIYCVNVSAGFEFNNTSWHYDNKNYVWIYSQQRTKLNQPPLFDLFRSDFVSYTKINESNNFRGNQVFGYDIGTGSKDTVLGFPLKYQINGTGYLFKNYFMTDTISITQNNVASSISTAITFLRYTVELGSLSGPNDTAMLDYRGDKYVNIWSEAITHRIPIIEIQTVVVSTTTLKLTCLDVPIQTADLSISAFVNGTKINVTISSSPTSVSIIKPSNFAVNDVVTLKIFTGQAPNDQGVYARSYVPAQTPNKNGYYETPLGLTNNPFNETFENLTLSELRDHLNSMIINSPETIYNIDSIDLPRNLSDMDPYIYARYGSRLIINETPLSFAQLFFGKKEYNVVNAIRQAAIDYDTFKLKLINVIAKVDSKLSPPDALDLALTIINADKDEYAPYRLSDMVPYGNNKIIRSIIVDDVAITTFDLSFNNFDLTKPSFQAVIVYLNGVQLLAKSKNYDFKNGAIVFAQKLRLGDVLKIHCYLDTRGSYVPATPSKLGLYMIHTPQFESAENGAIYIRGHDNSWTLAFNDYRDNILLEYEKRVYNNLKVNQETLDPRIYNLPDKYPGLWKVKPYTRADLFRIMSADFYSWCGRWSVDGITNNTSDIKKPKTWNYGGSRLQTFSGAPSIPNINEVIIPLNNTNWMYNTESPETTPWCMLGIFDKPKWWDTVYGPAPYLASNVQMWTDISNGYVRSPELYPVGLNSPKLQPGYYVAAEWKRPGLYPYYLPVDADGTRRSWRDLLIPNTATDPLGEWKFGDNGPAEAVWAHSTNYTFAICAAMAILDPVAYCATQYDVSRTSINNANQLVYNNKFLNLKELLIDSETDLQISGFGTYIAEYGRRFDRNFVSKFRQDINYLDSNLFHKFGGFASKDKLQIKIDSIDPTSTSPGVILPSEDYSLILNISNPINNARISGIIIQRYLGKFKIKGYDLKNSYFEIFKPIKLSTSGAVKVGGISEEFTDWTNVANNSNKGLSAADLTSASSTTTRYYKQGQIVRNNNRFYMVKVGHNAETIFDATLYEPLPELPIKGGVSVQASKTFENTITRIPYGTTLSSIQEVYDIIIGYGAFLETQGFVFDDYNADLNEILNWKLTGKEFLYWTTQNFADGNLITLSPFAHSLKYNYPNSVVDNISGSGQSYSLLKANGKPYPIDRFIMAREDTVCTIKTTDPNEGLFFASLDSIQKEHAMIFKNRTVFNDIIYDKSTGYKQQRIKLSGFRTKNWNGDLFSPGFVFDNVTVTDWQSYKEYIAGTVVRYNGKYYQSLIKVDSTETFDFNKWAQLPSKPTSRLLPNFDYKVDQFEDFYSLDIDNFDSSQQELAQHLTGYTPRNYLNNIFTNPISQYKFYQGFIKEKGTKNAFDKLSKAGQFSNRGQLSFKEEWAFRVGHYGSFETYKELEFTLVEGTSLENPYLVKFVDTIPSDPNPLINYIATSELLLTPEDYSASNALPSKQGTLNDNNIVLTTAGYVRLDDVTTTAYSKNSLLDIANNAMIQEGFTVWMGFLENGDWAVYRYTKQLSKITGVFVSAPTSEITFVTDGHHGLSIGDIVSVSRFNEQVNGVYVVTSIPTISQFTVASSLSSIENAELINYGGLYRFENARYPDLKSLSEITDLLKLNPGDKIWIDSGTDNKWQVYEKVKNYNPTVVETVGTPLDQEFGTSIWASDNSTVMLVSSPAWHTDNAYGYGRVKVYNQINKSWSRQYDYILNSIDKTYSDPASSTNFGYALQYDIKKRLYISGAPLASSVRSHSTGTGTVILSTGTGVAKSWANEGLVQILSRTEDHNKIDANIVLVNPYGQLTTTATNSKFGFSIAINQVDATTSTTLLVGAPGSSTGYVFAYKLNLTTATNATAIIQGFAHPTNVLSVRPPNTVALTSGSNWGYKVVGSVRGFAISAPAYNSTSTGGVVQLYNTKLQAQQTINSPFGPNGRFGHDIAISNDGAYLLISAPYIKNSNEPYGKVAVYKNLGNLVEYISTRAEVIYAYADNVHAPVYPTEDEIKFWMIKGLGTSNADFTAAIAAKRAAEPTWAASVNADRLIDSVIAGGRDAGLPIKESRARVIDTYRTHPDAQLYPDEASIRYWMENGLGSLFNVLTSRQLADGIGGSRRSTATNYNLIATLDYDWNEFMNAYAIRNADGNQSLNFTTSVSFNRSGIYIFELTGDNYVDMYLDGTLIISSYSSIYIERREVYVPQGTHVLRVAAYNTGGPAGIAFKITSESAFDNTDTSIFDQSVVYNNTLYPENYAIFVAERSAVSATWKLDQIITNPLSSSELKFGYSLSISDDNNTIGIGSLGKNRSTTQVFDINSNIGNTVFDNDSTKFYDSIPDGGSVYLYNRVGDKFIQADELNDVNIVAGSKYGSSLVVTNDDVFVGAPAPDVISNIDRSKFYIFNKIDTTSQSWKLLRSQDDTVDVSIINRVSLIDTVKEEVIEYLDVIDPVKGKIAGIADQELKYKAAFDPAVYSIGFAGTIVDSSTSWVDEHIGDLWWDLSTAKYMWYEQGDEIFRKNNWGRLFPGASIDVYEWVKSDLLPSEWAAQADTNKGLISSISGQPKYVNNDAISIKQVFNNITGSFENVYYFWVKNKVTLPDTKNRRLSAYQVASYIADPVSNGLKFIEILSPNAVAFANVQPSLIDRRINANIATDNQSTIPRHTEWLLLNENDPTSVPNTLLEKKLFDSLLGHDSLGNPVPDPFLTDRNRYGITIRPQQTLFKDRIEALRNLVFFVNSVFIKNRIVDTHPFDNLNKKEELPVEFSYEYDLLVEDIESLSEIVTTKYQQAEVTCYAENGKIQGAVITNPGFGYTIPPKITVITDSSSPAEFITEIDSQGKLSLVTIINPGNGYSDGVVQVVVRPHTVIVRSDSASKNRWTKYAFNYIKKVWVKVHTQSYNTTLFWKTVDWQATEFDKFKAIDYTVSDLFVLAANPATNIGNYLKVKNLGDGSFGILERVSGAGNFSSLYNIVYKENGTIQLLDTLWNYDLGKYTYDNSEIDETLYDQIPDLEINYILIALRDDIFVNELKVNWNLLFFVAVKYALTEQKLLDWAFKTSFINVTNTVGSLTQQPVYQLNNEIYFENYVNEIKPYRTKIRSYSSEYTSVDNANLSTTDFDFPSFYNETTNNFEIVSTTGTGLISTVPWKDWNNNHTLHLASIKVGHAGSGYSTANASSVQVQFVNAPGDTGSGAAARAYIRNDGIYEVRVTNPGSGYLAAPRAFIVGGPVVGNWWEGDISTWPKEVARVSVIMANDVVRATTIGMKFDRVSAAGELNELTATDEFVSDGTTDKFVLSWLPSPDKTTIVPLLDGKLIFEADYTIEYYQVNTENTKNDVAKMFPTNSWEGERPVDHRYRYYTSTLSSTSKPGHIRHYARFVFLNQVPSYNQVFKISYTKNIKLYNAVDRIFAFYNPTDSMPGDELALLMSGTEYPGLQVQGIKFEQAPNWDSTGTHYDVTPWNDAVSNYQIFEIATPMPKGYQGATYKISNYNPKLDSFVNTVPSYDVVRGMQISVVGSKPNEYFKANTTVEDVGGFGLSFVTSTGANFNPVKVYATGTTALSTMVIELDQVVTENLVPGDIISLYGVNALYGNSVAFINIQTQFTTTGVVTVTIPSPYFDAGVGARQATFNAVKTINTVTSFAPLDNGMGYSFVQLFQQRNVGWGLGYATSGLFTPNRVTGQTTGGGITITSTAPIYWGAPTPIPGTDPVQYYPDLIAYLDSSFSQSGLQVVSVEGNKIYTKTNIPLSSTGTAMYPDFYRNPNGTLSSVYYTPYAPGEAQYAGNPIWKTGIQVGSISKAIPANGRLLEYVNTITVVSTGSITIDTGVFYGDAMEAKISLSGYFRDIPTTNAPGGNLLSGGSLNYSTYPLPPNDGLIVYTITPSTDGKKRAIVTVYTLDGAIQMISGNLQVSIYGSTQLEVWLPNPGTNGLLDSLINSIYNYRNLVDSTAIGYQPQDIVIDGNNFLNSIDSYAPEECVPGFVNDVVGINVYTAGVPSSPVVMSGVIGVPSEATLPTRARINLLSDNSAGLLVYCNGIKFERVPTENFTTITQYSIIGDEIVIPVQPMSIRVGYSFVIVGSDVDVDSNYTVQLPDPAGDYRTYGDIVVESLMSIDDVRSVYVLVNDTNINQALTDGTTEYGYRLKPMSSTNKRASVHVQGVNPGALHTVQVWFFNRLFASFNRVHEQAFVVTATTSTLILDSIPGYAQPVSDKVIVEIISPTRRSRLLPPWVTYYKIANGQTTFAIDPINPRPSFYNLDNVKTYINGQELRPGYDFLVNASAQTVIITLPPTTMIEGAAIAIMPLVDYEYIIYNNKLTLTTSINTGTVRVTSFDDHDNMMLRTEKFTMNYSRYFTLSSPIISDNYLWVTLNDKWLIAGYDFKVLDDARTIEFSEFIEPGANAKVIVTIVNPPSYGTSILGYRQFYDMFGVQHFARLSTYFSTRLAQPLQYTDNQIFLEDGDHLFQPNPTLRLPGVIMLDGERIEYTAKDGNVLSGLRRGTLGTGPAKFSDVYTTVIDQSISQKINTYERINVQFIDSSNTNTYVISTLTNTLTDYTVNGANDYGDISLSSSIYHLSHGISLLTTSTIVNPPAAVDQVEVYYGGRKLRKTPLEVHDSSVSYYSIDKSITIMPPEFTITTATQTLILNINETITTGTRISVLQRLGKLWEENTSTSLLSSTGSRASFLSERPAQLPDIYYYGGDKVLYNNGVALTDETGENLEGY